MNATAHPATPQRAFASVRILASAALVAVALAAVSFGAVTSAKVLHQQVLASNSVTR